MTQHLPIVFCCDKNYAIYAAVASYSVCRHARHGLKLIWLVPSTDISDIEPVLQHLGQLGMRPKVIPVDGAVFSSWKQTGHITVTSYFRLLIPQVLDEPKVLYLDCDVLVLDDLAELFFTDMQGCALAGVEDIPSNEIRVPLRPGGKYINSGVMLMDLDQLRREDFFSRCQAIHDMHADKLRWMDQCVINCYASGQIKMLDTRWNWLVLANLTPKHVLQSFLNEVKPSVMHFPGHIKPWHAWCNPVVSDFWWQHAREIRLPGLSPVPIDSLDHAIELARVLDMNGDFESASQLKSSIINDLVNKK